jgi:hypothetical protein
LMRSHWSSLRACLRPIVAKICRCDLVLTPQDGKLMTGPKSKNNACLRTCCRQSACANQQRAHPTNFRHITLKKYRFSERSIERVAFVLQGFANVLQKMTACPRS